MKPNWSLPQLMQGLHVRVAQDLKIARETLAHPVAKGDGSEAVWISLFKKYLPQRYEAKKATIVDSLGKFSDQIDVVLFDRQYTPLIFQHENEVVVPIEAVYAVFESKQEINARNVRYAQRKVATVRQLRRTSAEVQTIDGKRMAVPQHILGGFLAFENGWKEPLEKRLYKALSEDQADGRLDLGCIAAYGTFGCEGADCLSAAQHERATTCFLLEIITRLQGIGTAPAIDMAAYAKWLDAK
jgi:hypothetical protein